MKRFITAMLFSLTVIVCEQQTLFAPHYYDLGVFTGVTSKTSPRNTLVPIAGVDRSVPLAGASYNPGKGASYNPGKGASRSIIHPQFSPSGPDRKPTVDGAMHPPGFNSRVPVAGYDCLGKGVYVTDSGDEEDDPFWDALPPDVYAGER